MALYFICCHFLLFQIRIIFLCSFIILSFAIIVHMAPSPTRQSDQEEDLKRKTRTPERNHSSSSSNENSRRYKLSKSSNSRGSSSREQSGEKGSSSERHRHSKSDRSSKWPNNLLISCHGCHYKYVLYCSCIIYIIHNIYIYMYNMLCYEECQSHLQCSPPHYTNCFITEQWRDPNTDTGHLLAPTEKKATREEGEAEAEADTTEAPLRPARRVILAVAAAVARLEVPVLSSVRRLRKVRCELQLLSVCPPPPPFLPPFLPLSLSPFFIYSFIFVWMFV